MLKSQLLTLPLFWDCLFLIRYWSLGFLRAFGDGGGHCVCIYHEVVIGHQRSGSSKARLWRTHCLVKLADDVLLGLATCGKGIPFLFLWPSYLTFGLNIACIQTAAHHIKHSTNPLQLLLAMQCLGLLDHIIPVSPPPEWCLLTRAIDLRSLIVSTFEILSNVVTIKISKDVVNVSLSRILNDRRLHLFLLRLLSRHLLARRPDELLLSLVLFDAELLICQLPFIWRFNILIV